MLETDLHESLYSIQSVPLGFQVEKKDNRRAVPSAFTGLACSFFFSVSIDFHFSFKMTAFGLRKENNAVYKNTLR